MVGGVEGLAGTGAVVQNRFMPTITFECQICGTFEYRNSIKEVPPPTLPCPRCDEESDRIWEAPEFICDRADKPVEYVPPQFRVSNRVKPESQQQGERIERAYQTDLESKRKIADESGKRDFQMTHSIPAHLYHGKVRETGDRNFWLDSKNRQKFKSCEIKKRK